ncbi:uncharacterized protein LOC142523731 [Primulina tabacum]|uniref:uncharacterized protein LOC142523731 n=1 Tax=Primulina tabacum TaxID=48773 RepID=UPI003F5A113C
MTGNIFSVTSPNLHPGMYGDGGMRGYAVPNSGNNTRGAIYLPHQVRQTPVLDFDTVRGVIQELYGPEVMPINRPEFHKPYPDIVDRDNPYPREYHIPDFTLYSGEDGQSSVEHVARFTIQCEELANLENFSNYKLRLFPNSLTSTAFTWCATLPRNSIMTWHDMEHQFHTQFFRTVPEISITELSRVVQKPRKSAIDFICKFKKLRSRCRVFLPESEYVKIAQRELDFELRKKFQGMEFSSYFQEVEEVASAEVVNFGSRTVLFLKRKNEELSKKNIPPVQTPYTFDASKTEEIFDNLVKEKFITFPPDHKLPTRDEIKGRDYCKYHNSFNHNTNACWAFKNILQERINKGILKFPEKNETMIVDEDPFPPVANVNVSNTDLRFLINEKRRSGGEDRSIRPRFTLKKFWVPQKMIFEVKEKKTEIFYEKDHLLQREWCAL